MKLAAGPADARARFHAPYVMRLDDPLVEQVEVITEFRRYVLKTEEEITRGNWMFSQRHQEARQTLRLWQRRLSIVARLRFHPQNNFVSVPPYEIVVAAPDVQPLDVIRTPIQAMLSGKPGDSAPLLGATIEAIFDAASVGELARPVRIALAGQDVKRVTIDFSKLE